MKIREILKEKLNQDKKLNKDKSRRGEYLSFSGIEKLMAHDCNKNMRAHGSKCIELYLLS
ncbi:hypothetical protein [Clostridium sp. BJN0013]|uniref:hypothetical protein n=1 Tax=Clostridium sp. BJN0013 TaxID=3236840 RepID=UPI0034C5D9C8